MEVDCPLGSRWAKFFMLHMLHNLVYSYGFWHSCHDTIHDRRSAESHTVLYRRHTHSTLTSHAVFFKSVY